MPSTSAKYMAFLPPQPWELKAMFLGRENAGRVKVGCIWKLSDRAPTQNQLGATPKSCVQILLPAPKEITFLFVSYCSSHPNPLLKQYKARFRFHGLKSFQLHSYILGNWWMDFKNLITYNNKLQTSLLIAFWSWSWYINMLPNQLSKLALMEFNILKA